MSNMPIALPPWTEADPDAARMSDLVAALTHADGPADAAGNLAGGALETAAGGKRPAVVAARRSSAARPAARPLLVQRYAQVASGSLTAVFILSQHDAAVRRLVGAPERPAARHWLEQIASGKAFATVGISQLTTSRRLGAHALMATEVAPGEFRLQGAMPWVTAAERADVFVTGALLEDGRQILLALAGGSSGSRGPAVVRAGRASGLVHGRGALEQR